MKFLWIFKVIALSTVFSMVSSDKARADLTVCNKSSYKAYVAVSHYSAGNWNSSGWAQIYGGECETVFRGNIRLNAPYVYIADDNWNAWNSSDSNKTSNFCILQSAFDIDNADKTCVDGMFSVSFQRVTSNDYDKVLYLN